MKTRFAAFAGGFRAEVIQLLQSRLFVVLTIVQAVTFLLLVSLFALTGSRAPTAIVSEDQGPYAKLFVTKLMEAHHSFALQPMDQESAQAALQKGDLVAIITIPSDFSNAIAHNQNTSISVVVDNLNTDMTDDIQRALPSAVVAFGDQLRFSGIHVHVTETDLIEHDTDFIPYLVVSGLVLDSFVIASILSAMTVAREFETGTVKLLAVAPLNPLISIVGRIAATAAISCAAMLIPLAVVVFGFKVTPIYPVEMVGALFTCIAIFSCLGVVFGAALKRTLPVASLVFGLSLPLYISSGSLEPARFDGNGNWAIAHLSPVYYAVGIFEQAFHGLRVTPEPISIDFLALMGWGVAMLLIAAILLKKKLA